MPEVTPGTSTSEFKLTVIAQILGAVLEGLSVVLHAFADAGVGGSMVSVALAVVGALLQIASLLGYQKARAMVKVAAAMSEVSVASPK